MNKKNNDKDENDPLVEIYQRVAGLERDVSWLGKLVSSNLFISVGEFITILIMIAYLVVH